jgi:hypothetical protein
MALGCGRIAVMTSRFDLKANKIGLVEFCISVPEGQRFKSSPRYQFQIQTFEKTHESAYASGLFYFGVCEDKRRYKKVREGAIAVELRYGNRIVFLPNSSTQSPQTLAPITSTHKSINSLQGHLGSGHCQVGLVASKSGPCDSSWRGGTEGRALRGSGLQSQAAGIKPGPRHSFNKTTPAHDWRGSISTLKHQQVRDNSEARSDYAPEIQRSKPNNRGYG